MNTSKCTIVTVHAITRFRQRFKLRINKGMWNDSGYRHMIRLMFNKATRADLRIRNQVGLYNSLCIRHGGLVEYYQYEDIIFACTRSQDRIVIRTVFQTGVQFE